MISWLFKHKKKRPQEEQQRFGIFIDLPSFRSLLFLFFVILPLILGIWYIWLYLLKFWLFETAKFVEVEEQKFFSSSEIPPTLDPFERWVLEELKDPEPIKSCDSHQFQCPFNPWTNETQIIPWTQRCDGHADCWNRADEKNCTTCLTSFSCPHADGKYLQCVPSYQICDGVANCFDDSDELMYCNRNCTDGEIPCGRSNNPSCVPISFICEGQSFCNSASSLFTIKLFLQNRDVFKIEGSSKYACSECTGYSRQCIHPYLPNHCVPIHKMCDGVPDCDDFRDEQFFHCNSTLGNCPGSCPLSQEDDEFRNFLKQRFQSWMNKLAEGKVNVQCSDGKWYSPLYACDGHHPQCAGKCQNCMPQAFHCDYGNVCIPSEKVCDGQNHCKDGRDEINCKDRPACDDEKNRCNGYCDCPDDCQDERNCTKCKQKELDRFDNYMLREFDERFTNHAKKMNETAKEWIMYLREAFHCHADNKCISLQQRCDGRKDCSDGYDEHGCSCSECMMHPQRMYVCQQHDRCFRYEEVCDESFETRCPNATQLDVDHCNLQRMESEKLVLN